MTKNTTLKEDGILGYDFIQNRAIIDGPNKALVIKSGSSYITFPFENHTTQKAQVNLIKDETEEEIRMLQQIEYLTDSEYNPEYEANLQQIRAITQEIDSQRIKINAKLSK